MLKTKTWVLLILALALACAGLSFYLLNRPARGAVVEIVQDGAVIRTIDLSRVTREETFTVAWPGGGENEITVQPDRIRVSRADCPDKICVGQGWLSHQAAPIACMPHRLLIRLSDQPGADAVSQ